VMRDSIGATLRESVTSLCIRASTALVECVVRRFLLFVVTPIKHVAPYRFIVVQLAKSVEC